MCNLVHDMMQIRFVIFCIDDDVCSLYWSVLSETRYGTHRGFSGFVYVLNRQIQIQIEH